MASVYVNFFRVTGNPDEVLLDLGMYSQVIAPGGAEPIELTHRLIMNFVTAKKLAEVLRVVVARHGSGRQLGGRLAKVRSSPARADHDHRLAGDRSGAGVPAGGQA